LTTGEIGRDDPRHNVLSFYGIGGVGKTQLLLRLKAWVTGDQTMRADWGEQPLPRAACARYRDLGRAWTVDAMLLLLRSMAVETGVATRAFDVGLYAWWTHARSGEDMPDVGSAGGRGAPGARARCPAAGC
jgi:hypothetical protein